MSPSLVPPEVSQWSLRYLCSVGVRCFAVCTSDAVVSHRKQCLFASKGKRWQNVEPKQRHLCTLINLLLDSMTLNSLTACLVFLVVVARHSCCVALSGIDSRGPRTLSVSWSEIVSRTDGHTKNTVLFGPCCRNERLYGVMYVSSSSLLSSLLWKALTPTHCVFKPLRHSLVWQFEEHAELASSLRAHSSPSQRACLWIQAVIFLTMKKRYNSISLGLTVLAVLLLERDRDLLGAVAFTLALNYKQMELYHAMPFFCYLFGSAVKRKNFW